MPSSHGLITGVAYRLGDGPPAYMLEGAVAVTGALVQWLRDNLGVIGAAAEVEELAASVPDSDGCVIVPAFSGPLRAALAAGRARRDLGLTQFHTKAHLARAALDATAYATRELVDAMVADAGVALPALRVDGGMTANELLLRIQADVLGLPVVRPAVDGDHGARRRLRSRARRRLLESLDELRANERGERTPGIPTHDGRARARLRALERGGRTLARLALEPGTTGYSSGASGGVALPLIPCGGTAVPFHHTVQPMAGTVA